MFFLGLPSALPCWKCNRNAADLIDQREPDTSSAQALKQWFQWFQLETEKHVQEEKRTQGEEEQKIPPQFLKQFEQEKKRMELYQNVMQNKWYKKCPTCP